MMGDRGRIEEKASLVHKETTDLETKRETHRKKTQDIERTKEAHREETRDWVELVLMVFVVLYSLCAFVSIT